MDETKLLTKIKIWYNEKLLISYLVILDILSSYYYYPVI